MTGGYLDFKGASKLKPTAKELFISLMDGLSGLGEKWDNAMIKFKCEPESDTIVWRIWLPDEERAFIVQMFPEEEKQ